MDNELTEIIKKIIDDIKCPWEEIKQIQFQRLDFINSRIKYILKNNIDDIMEIERILDELLDIAYWDSEIMEENFHKLINYYKNIDDKNAKVYEKYYFEIIKEDID